MFKSILAGKSLGIRPRVFLAIACLVVAPRALKAQPDLGFTGELGVLKTLLESGSAVPDKGETRFAYGAAFIWGPGDLLVKPAFITDGKNHAVSLSFGGRLYGWFGVSGRVNFVRDRFEDFFFNPNDNEVQSLRRDQWFAYFGADISYHPGYRFEGGRKSLALMAGFGFLGGGSFIFNAGIGYTWRLKKKVKPNE